MGIAVLEAFNAFVTSIVQSLIVIGLVTILAGVGIWRLILEFEKMRDAASSTDHEETLPGENMRTFIPPTKDEETLPREKQLN